MEIVSVDIGNLTTVSVCKGKHFIVESRLKEWREINSLNSDEIYEFQGKKYIVGEGDFENNIIKYRKENFLPLLYYAISKVTDERDIKLVVGIPAGQFSKGKEELKKFIQVNNFKRFKINDTDKEISIEDVLVVPESYGLKANGTLNQGKQGLFSLIIDIGGGTTDIAEFDENSNFTDGKSIKKGILNIYRHTQEILGDFPYNLNLSLAQAKKYFDGEMNLMDGYNSYKDDIAKKFVKNIINELKGLYPNIDNCNIILTGGGCQKFIDYFRQEFPQIIPVSDITANCFGFEKIGGAKWQM